MRREGRELASMSVETLQAWTEACVRLAREHRSALLVLGPLRTLGEDTLQQPRDRWPVHRMACESLEVRGAAKGVG